LDNFKREPFPIKESITTFENIPILKKRRIKRNLSSPSFAQDNEGAMKAETMSSQLWARHG